MRSSQFPRCGVVLCTGVNQLTGDYLRARSRYMQEIPIPDLTSTHKALIGKIVDYLIYLQGATDDEQRGFGTRPRRRDAQVF